LNAFQERLDDVFEGADNPANDGATQGPQRPIGSFRIGLLGP
jgi:hypothetical protein